MPRIFTILNFAFLSILAQEKTTRKRRRNFVCIWDEKSNVISERVPQRPMHRQSLCRYNPISTNPRSLCSENPRRVAPTQILAEKILRTRPSSGRDHPPNAQTAGELCVDKTQSAQICNLCVEKNPRPRRARTNSGRAQLLNGKTSIGRCSNNFLLANRPMIVLPIRKTPVQNVARKIVAAEKLRF